MYLVQQAPSRYAGYPVKAGLVLACIQISLGVLSILLQAFIIGTYPHDHVTGSGFYCGLMYVIAGGLGIGASQTKGGRCLVISTMVLSILAAAIAFAGQGSTSAIGIVIHRSGGRYIYGDRRQTMEDGLAKWSVMLILAFMEGIVAIVQSTLCCRGLCCSSPAGQPVYYAVSPQQVVVGGGTGGGKMAPSAPGPLVQLPNGQVAMMINAPPAEAPENAVPPAYQEKSHELQ